MITLELLPEEQQVAIEIQEVIENASGTGTNDYEKLTNKPSINEVVLSGDKTFEDLGLTPLTNIEIMQIINRASKQI